MARHGVRRRLRSLPAAASNDGARAQDPGERGDVPRAPGARGARQRALRARAGNRAADGHRSSGRHAVEHLPVGRRAREARGLRHRAVVEPRHHALGRERDAQGQVRVPRAGAGGGRGLRPPRGPFRRGRRAQRDPPRQGALRRQRSARGAPGHPRLPHRAAARSAQCASQGALRGARARPRTRPGQALRDGGGALGGAGALRPEPAHLEERAVCPRALGAHGAVDRVDDLGERERRAPQGRAGGGRGPGGAGGHPAARRPRFRARHRRVRADPFARRHAGRREDGTVDVRAPRRGHRHGRGRSRRHGRLHGARPQAHRGDRRSRALPAPADGDDEPPRQRRLARLRGRRVDRRPRQGAPSRRGDRGDGRALRRGPHRVAPRAGPGAPLDAGGGAQGALLRGRQAPPRGVEQRERVSSASTWRGAG